MKFEIPPIFWEVHQCEVSTRYIAMNTFVQYIIFQHRYGGNYITCWDFDGELKYFETVEDAKWWVLYVDYPRHVKKYFVECE